MCVDSVHEHGGRKKFGDEKYETEGYKILRKKRSERKQGFETLSSSSKNEKKSTDSVSINFLLEILIFNFIIFNRLSFFFFMNLFFMN